MAKKISATFYVNFYCGGSEPVYTKKLTAADAEDYYSADSFDPYEFEEEIYENGGDPEWCFTSITGIGKVNKNCKTVDDFYDGLNSIDNNFDIASYSSFEISNDNPFFEYDEEHKVVIYKPTNEIVYICGIGRGRLNLPEGDYKMTCRQCFSYCNYHSPLKFPEYVTSLPKYCFYKSRVFYIYIDGALKGTKSIFAGIRKVKMIVAGRTDPSVLRASYGVRIAAVKGYAKAYYDGKYDVNLVDKWNEFIMETLEKSIERRDTFKLHPNVQNYIKKDGNFPSAFIDKLRSNGMIS